MSGTLTAASAGSRQGVYAHTIDQKPATFRTMNKTPLHNAQKLFQKALLAPSLTAQVSYCEQALWHDATFAPAWYWRGSVRLAQGLFAGAVTDFSRALQLDPTFSRAYDERGYALLQLGRYEAALVDFDIAQAHHPQNEYLQHYRALAQQKSTC